MNVNNNVITSNNSKKYDIMNSSNKNEEFKKALDNQELRSKDYSNKKYTNDNAGKVRKENKSDNIEKTMGENAAPKDLKNPEDNDKIRTDTINPINIVAEMPKQTTEELISETSNNLKVEIINFLQTSLDILKQSTDKPSEQLLGEDESTDEMSQIQQLLQLLSSMFQNTKEPSTTENGEVQINSINLEQLMGKQELIGGEKLTTETKTMLKDNLSELVAMLEKSKGNAQVPSQIIDVIQKLTTEVAQVKGDLNPLKVTTILTPNENSEDKLIRDNLLKKVIEVSAKTIPENISKNQMQSSNDSKKDNKFSGNSSFEENFLKNLLGEDKDESKISKAVNFMNQFESVKTVDTTKIQTTNLAIDKNSITVDVIKSIKFMEINNMKDLTVKMSPKELGEITIKLTMESGVMKAFISAQNKDTYNLLNQNIQDISDRLKNMDIKIQSLDINIYEDSTFFNKDSNQKNSNETKNNNRDINMVSEDEDISISNNYVIEENQVNKFV